MKWMVNQRTWKKEINGSQTKSKEIKGDHRENKEKQRKTKKNKNRERESLFFVWRHCLRYKMNSFSGKTNVYIVKWMVFGLVLSACLPPGPERSGLEARGSKRKTKSNKEKQKKQKPRTRKFVFRVKALFTLYNK